MKVTKYMFVITTVLVIGLVMNAGCRKGAQDGGVADLGDGGAPAAGTPPAGEGSDITINEVKLILPNDEEVDVDSNRISRHSKIKILYEGELSSDIGLKMGGTSVAYAVLSDADGEAILKPKMPLHNLKEYELGDATFKVKAPGDINGDGLSDFVVGAPHWLKGSAHIFLGNEDMDYLDYTSGKRIDGNVDNAEFGSAFALGDINGDGLDDIAIGVPEEGRGCVYVFHGVSQIPDNQIANGSQNTRICRTNMTNTLFGEAVALGDLNGDGLADLIVGESKSMRVTNTAPIYMSSGAVEIFWGNKNGIGNRNVSDTEFADASYYSTTNYQRVGYSLAAGDLNGDGIDDVVIGALGSDKTPAPGCVQGKTYIALGASDPGQLVPKMNLDDSDIATTLIGEGCVNDHTDRFGLSLSAMTAAEKDDVLIGSKSALYKYVLGSTKEMIMGIPLVGQGVIAGWLGEDIGFGYPPTSKLLIFDPEGDMQNPTIYDGSTTSSALGCAISPAGDLNGDGDPDFVIGEKKYIEVGINERGRVWINALQKSIDGFGDSHFGTAVVGGRIR